MVEYAPLLIRNMSIGGIQYPPFLFSEGNVKHFKIEFILLTFA